MMTAAADVFGIDFDVVVDDIHYRAAASYVVSTMALFGKTLNSVRITVVR